MNPGGIAPVIRVACPGSAGQVSSDHPPRMRVGDSKPRLNAVVVTFAQDTVAVGACPYPSAVGGQAVERGSARNGRVSGPTELRFWGAASRFVPHR